MDENLRQAAHRMIQKFKFVLEKGADAYQETFWIEGENKDYTPKSISQYLDGFSLGDVQAMDLVIRKEYDDSKVLMEFANTTLADYLFVRQQEQLVGK